MRGEDGAFMRAQRLGNPWGSLGARPVFEGEHVGGVGAEGAAVQGGGDGVLVDDRSAADVDEHGVGGEPGQLLGTDEARGGRCEWCGDDDRVAPGEEGVDADRA